MNEPLLQLDLPGIKKVKSGKVQSTDMYAPPGVDVNALSLDEKINILIAHSIYLPARANWTEEALAGFETAEIAIADRQDEAMKYKGPNEYDSAKKCIKFLGSDRDVTAELIN